MSDDIIYERKYGDILRKLSEQGIGDKDTLSPVVNRDTAGEYVRALLSNTVRVIMPECLEGKVKFIETAKEIEAEYLIDLTISAFNNYDNCNIFLRV